MNKCYFCNGFINSRCFIRDDKRAHSCKEARKLMNKSIKGGQLIRIDRYSTRINGVDKLNDIEICLNQIGYKNIMHISTIGDDMLVVYKEKLINGG